MNFSLCKCQILPHIQFLHQKLIRFARIIAFKPDFTLKWASFIKGQILTTFITSFKILSIMSRNDFTLNNGSWREWLHGISKWNLTPVNLTICSEMYYVPCKFQKSTLHSLSMILVLRYWSFTESPITIRCAKKIFISPSATLRQPWSPDLSPKSSENKNTIMYSCIMYQICLPNSSASVWFQTW